MILKKKITPVGSNISKIETTLVPKIRLCTEGSGEDRKLVLYRAGVKDCVSYPESMEGFTCDDVAECPIILDILEAIEDLEEATTLEAIQQIIIDMLVHNQHVNIDAAYDSGTGHIVLTGMGGGGGTTCEDVALCIETNAETQAALLERLENTPTVNLTGDWTFNGETTFAGPTTFTGDVTNDGNTINNVGSTTNYDSDSITNHNGDEINYTNATINSTGTTYNHDDDVFNIDDSEVNITNSTVDLTGTTVEGGTFNNINITGTVTGLVQGVTGNIVDNTDPANPVIDQVQPDWSATSGLGEILNKSVRPDELAGTTTDDSLVVRDTAGTFRDATASDISSLGFSIGGYIEKTEIFVAGESISTGQHLAKSYYEEKQLVTSNILKTYTVAGVNTTTVNYGEAFNRPVSSPLGSAIANIRVSTSFESGGSSQAFSYSLTAKIYAISGSLGTTAVDAGAALLTSNTLTGNISFNSLFQNPSFTFDGVTSLPAGQYAMKIEGNINGLSSGGIANGVLRVNGDNTGAYIGNAIDLSTAVAGSDMGFVIRSTRDFAVIADATNADKIQYLGQATEAKTFNQNIIIKTRGNITQSGASNNDDTYYLSNTPGTLSTTPGTNEVIVGKGTGANQISIRGLFDLSTKKLDKLSQANSGLYKTFLSGGGLINYAIGSIPATSSYLFEESDDNITFRVIANGSQTTGSSNTDIQSTGPITVPRDKFVRVTTAGITYNLFEVIPM